MRQVAQKSQSIFHRPKLAARVGLFIVEDQESYYNALNAPNYLPANTVHSRGGGIIQTITLQDHFLTLQ
jgi:hypothetical protein